MDEFNPLHDVKLLMPCEELGVTIPTSPGASALPSRPGTFEGDGVGDIVKKVLDEKAELFKTFPPSATGIKDSSKALPAPLAPPCTLR